MEILICGDCVAADRIKMPSHIWAVLFGDALSFKIILSVRLKVIVGDIIIDEACVPAVVFPDPVIHKNLQGVFVLMEKIQAAVEVIQGEIEFFKKLLPAVKGSFFRGRGKEPGINKEFHDSIGIVGFFGMALSVGKESMDAEFVVDAAQCGIAEISAQGGIGEGEPVGIIKAELDRGLSGIFFRFQGFHSFGKESNGILILFFEFIEPTERLDGFLSGAFILFVIIRIHYGKADAALEVRCFFKMHSVILRM